MLTFYTLKKIHISLKVTFFHKNTPREDVLCRAEGYIHMQEYLRGFTSWNTLPTKHIVKANISRKSFLFV